MFFELTDSLTTAILYAMENQQQQSLLDATALTLIPAAGVSADEERFYTLPTWTSNDGFKMLESFVFSLGASAAKTELKDVLVAGRGVFRNFKNVLKAYPELERRWHFYKDKRLRQRLMEWYNALREAWGLEALGQDFDDYDELTKQDFTFVRYNPRRDADCVAAYARAVAVELEHDGSELAIAAATLWRGRFAGVALGQKDGFVCRALADEFVGCLLSAPCPSPAKETVVLTDFFVTQNYRGLGIARTLMALCISSLRERGIHWLIIADTTIPQQLDALITRMGFERQGLLLVADVTKL